MRSLHSFIVEIKAPKREEIEYGTLKLITPDNVTKFDEYNYINWETKVVSVPEWYGYTGVQVGDSLIAHHSLFINKKNQLNSSGIQNNSFCIDEEKGLYFVPYMPEGRDNLAYVSIDKDGGIHALGDVLLCEPNEKKDEFESESGLLIKHDENQDGLELTCKVAYSNPLSESKGIKAGSTVTLANFSDYEIEIGGKTYWRIFDSDIYYREDDYLKPYNKHICVRLEENKEETDSGIYLNNKKNLRSDIAVIAAMGFDDDEIKTGDTIIIEDLSQLDIINADKRMFYTIKDNISCKL